MMSLRSNALIDAAIVKHYELATTVDVARIRLDAMLILDAKAKQAPATKQPCNEKRGWYGTKPGCSRQKPEGGEVKSKPKAKQSSVTPKAMVSKVKAKLKNKGVDIEGLSPEKLEAAIAANPNASSEIKKEAKTIAQNVVKPEAKSQEEKKKKSDTPKGKGGHTDYTDYAEGKNIKIIGEELADNLGVSQEEGEFIAKTANSWTRTGYKKMRTAQKSGKTTPEVDAMEKLIAGSPKYDGPVFRGLAFKSEKDLNNFLGSIKEGFELDAMSSFSSDEKLATNFAKGEGGTATKASTGVLIRVKQNKSGVSVSPFAKMTHKDEFEVVPPKGAKYKPIGSPKIELVSADDKKIADNYNANRQEFEKTAKPSYAATLLPIVGEDEAVRIYRKGRENLGLPDQSRDKMLEIIKKQAQDKKFIQVIDVEEV